MKHSSNTTRIPPDEYAPGLVRHTQDDQIEPEGQRRGARTYLALDLPEHAVLDLLVRERVREQLVACNDTQGSTRIG